MNKSCILLSAALLLLATHPPTPPAVAGDESFRETVTVEPGTRLDLQCQAGYAYIRTWDRNQVEIQAERGFRDEIRVRQVGDVLLVKPHSEHGKPSVVDFQISVPKWMALSISGHHLDVEIDGSEGEIEVDVVNGELQVRGGRGTILLRSVQGGIDLEGAQGKIDAGSTNESIRLLDCKGPILAETINGDLRLEGINSDAVEGTTLNGDIFYDGTVSATGDYYFATHNGDVEVSVPQTSNVTVTIASVEGRFNCDFDVQLLDARPGKRFKFALGEGTGKLRIESFQGDIDLFDPKGGRRKRG